MTIQSYLDNLPDERKVPFNMLRKEILDNLPRGFEECINYNMLGYIVPHSTYPAGYHCDPKQPLPFINLANQKNTISLYHMGLYANEELLDWFTNVYPEHAKYKLNMGKSCIRFKRMDDIPFELIGVLMSKMTVDDWIKLYESHVKP